jgi:hypothetical protein
MLTDELIDNAVTLSSLRVLLRDTARSNAELMAETHRWAAASKKDAIIRDALYAELHCVENDRDDALLEVEKLEKTVAKLEETIQHLRGTIDAQLSIITNYKNNL